MPCRFVWVPGSPGTSLSFVVFWGTLDIPPGGHNALGETLLIHQLDVGVVPGQAVQWVRTSGKDQKEQIFGSRVVV
jgi:hypothetical protein